MLPDFVLGDLLVNSTSSVNCDPWNQLRTEGHVLGNYSCQGTTKAIGSRAAVNEIRSGVVILSAALLSATLYLL